MKHPKYNRSSNCLTVLFAYGYLETIKRGSSPIIIDAYSERSDHNLIILDWSDVSKSLSSNYQLMLNVSRVFGICKLILKMTDNISVSNVSWQRNKCCFRSGTKPKPILFSCVFCGLSYGWLYWEVCH